MSKEPKGIPMPANFAEAREKMYGDRKSGAQEFVEVYDQRNRAVEIIKEIQWSHCGVECAACGGQYSGKPDERYGHKKDCPIVVLFEELGLPTTCLSRVEKSKAFHKALTVEQADEALKDFYKDGEGVE